MVKRGPHSLVRSTCELSNHDRAAFFATVVLDGDPPVTLADANEGHAAFTGQLGRTSLKLRALIA